MRQQRVDLYPAGQAIGHCGQSHQIRRAGQEESAGTAILIDGELERQQQFGGPLHFVDDQAVLAPDEAERISTHRRQQGGVVQGEIGHTVRVLPHQCGLAALTRTIDEQGRRIAQGGIKQGMQVTMDERGSHCGQERNTERFVHTVYPKIVQSGIHVSPNRILESLNQFVPGDFRDVQTACFGVADIAR